MNGVDKIPHLLRAYLDDNELMTDSFQDLNCPHAKKSSFKAMQDRIVGSHISIQEPIFSSNNIDLVLSFCSAFPFLSLLKIISCNHLEPRRPHLSAVNRPAKVAAHHSAEEQNNLEQEPRPAATLFLGLAGATGPATAARGIGAAEVSVQRVQVLRLERDDIVVVAQLAGLGGETQICDSRDGDVGVCGRQLEAVGPRVFRLVLQIQAQGLVLEVGETKLGWDGSIAEATSLVRC